MGLKVEMERKKRSSNLGRGKGMDIKFREISQFYRWKIVGSFGIK